MKKLELTEQELNDYIYALADLMCWQHGYRAGLKDLGENHFAVVDIDSLRGLKKRLQTLKDTKHD